MRIMEGHNSPSIFSEQSHPPSDLHEVEATEVKETPSNYIRGEKENDSISIRHFIDNPTGSDFLHLKQEDCNSSAVFGTFPSVKEKGVLLMDDDDSCDDEIFDGEDSNLDSGTDDEKGVFVYGRGDLPHQEEKVSPLLLNSVVAFGSEDWNDFMLETGNSDIFSLVEMDPFKTAESNVVTPTEVTIHKTTERVDSSPNHTGPSDMNESNSPAISEEYVTDMHLAVSVASHGDDNSSNHQHASATITETTHHGIDVQVPMDMQSCRGRNISSEEDSHAGGTLQSFVEAPSSVECMCFPHEPCSKHIHVADKVIECGSDEEVEHFLEISTREVLGSPKTPTDGTLDVRVFEQMINENIWETESDVHEPHEANVSTKTVIELKPNAEQCLYNDDFHANEINDLHVKELYDDMVEDMEAVLLESVKPYEPMLDQVTPGFSSQQPQHYRNGSSTASTSGVMDVSPKQSAENIEWIEVVGARQKRGEVSLGERLVGVKEYTVYVIRVWSGDNQWEVERRYRDFFALYHQLKRLFIDHGLSLPSQWFRVEQESRKIFGNASPDVINGRSTLIQECLRSILYIETHMGTPSSLAWFLSQENTSSTSLLSSLTSFSSSDLGSDEGAIISSDACELGATTLAKTVSLVVGMHPTKSMKQLLETQHYKCAGCCKHLEAKKSLMHNFAQTLGWGKPRLCEYTGQLFCSTCHSNQTAILPARVLHYWDFSLCPVSHVAKTYLDSIHDQPMLCVSAVNPFLFSRVPTLLHIIEIRKKIAAMLECVRCPFHRSIQRTLGSRKYLLENNDLFALRDLVDLSKGAFAALPVMMETLSKKTEEHITQLCLICCDVGEPCGARLACDDPSALIFPFQVITCRREADRCSSCGSVFHKHCFKKLPCCPCNISSGQRFPRIDPFDDQKQEAGNDLGNFSGLTPRYKDSKSAMSVLSNMFSKVKLEVPWGSKSSPVVLMGSCPSPPS